MDRRTEETKGLVNIYGNTGPGNLQRDHMVIFVPHLDGATGYFESWLYGAMAYSGVRFQRGQRLCWSTPVRGHELYLVFTGLFHSENTGPWQISNTGLKIISVGDFNGAMDNFLSSGYGAIRFLGCLNQRGHSKSRHRSPLISRSRIPINIDRSLAWGQESMTRGDSVGNQRTTAPWSHKCWAVPKNDHPRAVPKLFCMIPHYGPILICGQPTDHFQKFRPQRKFCALSIS